MKEHVKKKLIDEGIIDHIDKLNACAGIVSSGYCTSHKDDDGNNDHSRSLPYLAVKASQQLGHYIEHSIFEEFIRMGWATRCDKRMSFQEVERDNVNIVVYYVMYGIMHDYESLQRMLEHLILRVDMFNKSMDPAALYYLNSINL